MIKKITSLKSIYSLVVVLIAVFVFINYADAITSSVIKSTNKAHRYRVTYTDIQAGTNVVFPNNPAYCKKITLYTMGAQDQIISFVSNLTTSFRTANTNANVYAVSIRPERSGVEVSGFDIALPPDLYATAPLLETRLGNSTGYLFFSESLATDVVLTVCGDENLATLTQGQIDFFILKVE